jgi:CheY-like chemotaxis protein
MMNGKIWVESQKDVGSNFIFEIELEQKDDKKTFQVFNDKRVLVVDDSQAWHDILENVLDMFDIEVKHAYSGSEALKILQKCDGKKYDLILMDWNMSGLDGIGTTKQLYDTCDNCEKNSTCDISKPISVIMISSFRQESIINLAKNAGVNLFLQKPINPSVLNDILSSIFLNKPIDYNYLDNSSQNNKININALKGSTILLAEDNTTNQEIVVGLLENSGINIDIANNGKEAVEKFKNNIDKYELILMDIQMPIMDGYEATSQIRTQNKDIPIIALSANAMQIDREKTKQAGMNEHLNKPIEVDKFYTALLKYISKKIKFEGLGAGSKDDILIPTFSNIDTTLGLLHLANNKKLYLKILNDFYNNYKDIKLEELNNEELKRVAHTIKGLSASIGAKSLSAISEELETTLSKNLFDKFYKVLNKVLDDLKKINTPNTKQDLKPIEEELKTKLFTDIKGFASKKRSKNIKEIIQRLELHDLAPEDKKLLDKINSYLEKRDYKAIQSRLQSKQNEI